MICRHCGKELPGAGSRVRVLWVSPQKWEEVLAALWDRNGIRPQKSV